MKHDRRAQIALEFMVMMSMAIVISLTFLGVLGMFSHDYSEQRNLNRLRDLGYSLQSELVLAAEVEPGYERTIEIPQTLPDNVPYEINITGRDLVLEYRGGEILFPIPNVTGTLKKGTNTITKNSLNQLIIS